MIRIRNTVVIVLVSLVAAALYNAFSTRGIPWVPKVEVVAQGAKPRLVLSNSAAAINYIDVQQAQAKYDERVPFLDSREPEEYRAGHVAGAMLIPAKEEPEAIAALVSGFAKDQELIVYCDGEECGASQMLAGKLQRLGYSNVQVFFGGWTEWQRAGLPVEKGR